MSPTEATPSPKPTDRSPAEPPAQPDRSDALDHSDKPRQPTGLIFITIAWTVVLVTVGAWCSHRAAHRNDQYQLIALGQCVRDGGVMYIDCWENKPPGIAWVNAAALWLSGGRQIAAWVMPGLTALLALGVLGVALARSTSVVSACVAVMLAATALTLRVYDAPSINPDFYSASAELLACALWIVAITATRTRSVIGWALVAGLCWAAATVFKQTGVTGLAATTVATLLTPLVRTWRSRRWFIACAGIWLGFAIGAAAVVALLHYRGSLDEASAAIFEFNRGLLSWDAVTSAVRSWPRAWDALSPVALLVWLGLVGLVATLRAGSANKLASPFALAMLVWWIVAVLAALIGPSGSMRYYQSTMPPMIFLAAAGAFHLGAALHRLGRVHRSATLVTLATVVFLLGRPLFDHYREGVTTAFETHRSRSSRRGELEEIGQRVQELTQAGESIYVLAYDAGVYVFADRRAASRFTYPRSTEQMQEILADLESGKAALILKPKRSASAFEQWCDTDCHKRLDAITASYESLETIGTYTILKQRPSPPASP